MADAENQDLILFTRGNPAEEAIPLADIVDCAGNLECGDDGIRCISSDD